MSRLFFTAVHSFQPPATLNKWSISAGDQTASHLTERKGGKRSSGCWCCEGGEEKKKKTWETCLEVPLEGSLHLMCVFFFFGNTCHRTSIVQMQLTNAAAGINRNFELLWLWDLTSWRSCYFYMQIQSLASGELLFCNVLGLVSWNWFGPPCHSVSLELRKNPNIAMKTGHGNT